MNGNGNFSELTIVAPRHEKYVETLTQYFPFSSEAIEPSRQIRRHRYSKSDSAAIMPFPSEE
jgi:hypothetical protein